MRPFYLYNATHSSTVQHSPSTVQCNQANCQKYETRCYEIIYILTKRKSRHTTLLHFYTLSPYFVLRSQRPVTTPDRLSSSPEVFILVSSCSQRWILPRSVQKSTQRWRIIQLSSHYNFSNISGINICVTNKKCQFSKWSSCFLNISEQWVSARWRTNGKQIKFFMWAQFILFRI